MKNIKALIIDDDSTFRTILKEEINSFSVSNQNDLLESGRAKLEIIEASNLIDGFKALEENSNISILFLDKELKRKVNTQEIKDDGFKFVKQIKEMHPETQICCLTGNKIGADEARVLLQGANTFIEKHELKDKLGKNLRNLINDYLAYINKIHKSSESFNRNSPALSMRKVPGVSAAVSSLNETVNMVSQQKSNLLLSGDSGTGKSMLAKIIHNNFCDFMSEDDTSRDLPFISINAGAIPDNLFESALFGHIKGSFTGAEENYLGAIRTADGGTLVLDEVHNLSYKMQGKLLEVLQEKQVTPVGSTNKYKVDFRVISITNTDLKQRVEKGEFREDLYYRLVHLNITVPGIKERRQDIPLLLAPIFLEVLTEFPKLQASFKDIPDDFVQSLMDNLPKNNLRGLSIALRTLLTYCRKEAYDMQKRVNIHIPNFNNWRDKVYWEKLEEDHDALFRAKESTPITIKELRERGFKMESNFPGLKSFYREIEDLIIASSLVYAQENQLHEKDLYEIIGVGRTTFYRRKKLIEENEQLPIYQ